MMLIKLLYFPKYPWYENDFFLLMNKSGLFALIFM
jgi:hypothetical protein